MRAEINFAIMNSIKKPVVSLVFAIFATTLTLTGAAFATPAENAPIWRVQMRIQTADVGDAGTDDSVRVRLNAANSTWLDYGRDDFPRNNTFTYDLKMDGISRISDLDYISISKTGDDGLCLKSFALLINGREIYTEIFPGSGHWLDTDSGHSPSYFVSGTAMRLDNSWVAYTQPFPPLAIPNAEIVSRIEGMVGDFIHGKRLQWGHKYGSAYVEVVKKPGAVNTLEVDLDLELDLPYWFNPEVDVNFDIQVRCIDNQVVLKVTNVTADVDSDVISELLSLGIIEFLDDSLADRLNEGLRGINLSLKVEVPFCPVINVDNDGDINFSLPTVLTRAQAPAEQSRAPQLESSETIED